jgi:hypothetical protein
VNLHDEIPPPIGVRTSPMTLCRIPGVAAAKTVVAAPPWLTTTRVGAVPTTILTGCVTALPSTFNAFAGVTVAMVVSSAPRISVIAKDICGIVSGI